jgi:septum site-determining protein MinC
MQDVISIKGGKDSLRMQIDAAADWQEVLEALRLHLDQAGGFFAGARLVVEMGERQVSEHQLAEMLELLQQHGLRPESLASAARETRNAARTAGLAARPMPEFSPSQAAASSDGSSTLLCRTLHSGQVVRHPGHITLIGDVNAGAQVIAGGSVVIWGRLRGFVHAGAFGDGEAFVCALDLRPTQLRIATLIARAPEDVASNLPEIARIEGESIVVEPWGSYKRG